MRTWQPKTCCLAAALSLLTGLATASADEQTNQGRPSEATGWIRLFNGKDLSGWRASENADTFRVVDGVIVAHGERSHLFYTGDVQGAVFGNFELWVEVLTKPGANSGIYFHTEWQEEDWPAKGHQAQINQTDEAVSKTGGLHGVVDLLNHSPVVDNEWYSQHITVRDKHIVIRINGKVTTDYHEPEKPQRKPEFAGRVVGKGTFALQGHDGGSEVHFRQVWVKPLD